MPEVASSPVMTALKQHQEMVRGLMVEEQRAIIAEIAAAIVAAYRQGGKVLTFGNGGSAADAAHIAAELGGRFYFERDSLPAVALGDNTPMLTAIGNDYSYAGVFSRPLSGLGRPGDVAIGISTSGNSENVVRAVETACGLGMTTVALTGPRGNRLEQAADLCVCVPDPHTPRIQEGHILIGHTVCQIVEAELFGGGRP